MRWFVFLSSAFLLAVLSACGSSESAQPSIQLDRPALVMFYTDN
jgi:hypothetical protein